jgi:hypothetical protein
VSEIARLFERKWHGGRVYWLRSQARLNATLEQLMEPSPPNTKKLSEPLPSVGVNHSQARPTKAHLARLNAFQV